MRVILSSFAMAILIGPVSASAQEDDGLSLMERGARLFLEGVMREMEPALDELEGLGPKLRGLVEEMGPALADLVGQIEDWSVYHPPEILPNGDIILRRKVPKTPDEDAAEESEGPVDI